MLKQLLLENKIIDNKPMFLCSLTEDEVQSKFGNYERGIDNIKIGMLFQLSFTSFMDDDFIDAKVITSKIDRKNKTKEILKRAVKMPAIILAKRELDDWWVYDVGFWTKSNKGEQSGMIVIKDMCVWRYFGGDSKDVEGKPPKWLIDGFVKVNEPVSGIDLEDLFYIENSKEVYLQTKLNL